MTITERCDPAAPILPTHVGALLCGGRLSFAPRLPQTLTRLAFRVYFKGRRLLVDICPGEARYSLLEGQSLELSHHRDPLTLAQASRSSARSLPCRLGRDRRSRPAVPQTGATVIRSRPTSAPRRNRGRQPVSLG